MVKKRKNLSLIRKLLIKKYLFDFLIFLLIIISILEGYKIIGMGLVFVTFMLFFLKIHLFYYEKFNYSKIYFK